MTLTTLLVAAILVILLVYLGQQAGHPWNLIAYLVAIVAIVIALIRVLGIDLAIE